MIAGSMGPGGALLFSGALSTLVVPMPLLGRPETKGMTLEEIVPMFRFATLADFRRFVAGNLRSGEGMAHAAGKVTGAA